MQLRWLWLVMTAVTLTVGACGQSNPNDARAAEVAAEAAVVQEFARQYGATVPWADGRPEGRDDFRKTFTVDVEAELLVEGPVAILGEVSDVWREGPLYFAAIEPGWASRANQPYVIYELQVPQSIALQLLEERGEEFFDEHLVAAELDSVVRPRLGMQADGMADEFMYVEMDPDIPDVFIARGTMLGYRLLVGGLRETVTGAG